MSVRLTPINIISSLLIVSIAYLIISPDENGFRYLGAAVLGVLLTLSVIADLVFRRLIIDLKRIWIFEILFLIFVVAMMMLFNIVFN